MFADAGDFQSTKPIVQWSAEVDFYSETVIKTEAIKLASYYFLVYTELILVRLCRKLLAYRNTLESVPGINQYWAMSVKFHAQGNNGLSLRRFEPMRLAILRFLVRRVNHSYFFLLLLYFSGPQGSPNQVKLHFSLSLNQTNQHFFCLTFGLVAHIASSFLQFFLNLID